MTASKPETSPLNFWPRSGPQGASLSVWGLNLLGGVRLAKWFWPTFGLVFAKHLILKHAEVWHFFTIRSKNTTSTTSSFACETKSFKRNVRDARPQQMPSLRPIYNHTFQMQENWERQADSFQPLILWGWYCLLLGALCYWRCCTTGSCRISSGSREKKHAAAEVSTVSLWPSRVSDMTILSQSCKAMTSSQWMPLGVWHVWSGKLCMYGCKYVHFIICRITLWCTSMRTLSVPWHIHISYIYIHVYVYNYMCAHM